MARTFTTSLHTARRLLASGDGWLWVCEILRAPAVGGGVYRLAEVAAGPGGGRVSVDGSYGGTAGPGGTPTVGGGGVKVYQAVGPDGLNLRLPGEGIDGGGLGGGGSGGGGGGGGLGEVELTMGGVGRLALAELEARAIQGQLVIVRAVYTDYLANVAAGSFGASFRWVFRALRATAVEDGVRIQAGHPAGLRRCPPRVFDASVAPAFAGVLGG